MKKQQQIENKILASNRKAYHDYFIVEKYEAGISLSAGEVKSCHDKHISLSEGYITIDKGQLTLYNVHINHYKNDFWHEHNLLIQNGNKFIYRHEDIRENKPRRLLMHKKEILKLALKVREHGYTLIPLSLYCTKTNFIKVEVALVKGKHNYDKRQSLKEKDLKRELNAIR